jgi:DNA-directed RNA polymerase subunit M/transcription elongation factor TFIIS
MKFCPVCQSVLQRSTQIGSIVFHCNVCFTEEPGDEWDSLIMIGGPEDDVQSGAEEKKYEKLIATAAFDQVNEKIKKECPKCGLDYMTQIRVGDQERIIYKCKCGYEE